TGGGLPDVVYTGSATLCSPGSGYCVNPNPETINGHPNDVPMKSMNLGLGEFDRAIAMVDQSLGHYMSDWFGDQGMAIDYDGDGRMDFMLPVRGACPDHGHEACWVILRSPTDPFADGSKISTTIGQIIDDDIDFVHTWFNPKVTDVDGDGRQDLVAPTIPGDGTFTIYTNSGPQDLLVSVTDGMSPLDPGDPGFVPTVSITYGSLVDTSITQGIGHDDPKLDGLVYIKQADPNNPCKYPRTCVVGPGRVVSHYSLNDGQDEPRDFSVRYRDGRYHRLGRGMLGFGERIVVDDETGAGRAEFFDNTTWDDALHVFPFAGQMVESWSWAPATAIPAKENGQPGKSTQVELVYGKTTLHEVPTDPRTFFTLAVVTDRKRSEATFEAKAGQTLLAFASATRGDTKAVLSDMFTQISAHDAFGNVLQQDTFVKGMAFDDGVTRKVTNDTAHWLIGEVTYEQACSEGPPATQCRTTSRTFNGYGEVTGVERGDPTDPETQLAVAYARDAFGNVML